ncbi:MAG: hypothetical protein COV60_01515 [Candidatus Magasanikbacteria bacterium CG11_big_fil_rev_8_21_14_0_20_43_7]|uniref:Uncharacterized protein n=1 Tax=Candidatus Magasanikbacteria bacterium CG11_big_fil_rev_8_21_14_0_20_43_7 TaxID=1974654 RepID=A0A2H0N2T7_9BACT|nr:MAG: hypothetical protein COV60_01515 [Candidatus Magasanikbacteria bacterium CG11_big_fil_rev_8_21_14_0_20_43_7]
MRVALVNKYWFLKGGAERVLFLTKELLETAGHEVVCFGMRDERNSIQNEFFTDPVDYTSRGMARIKNSVKTIHNTDAKKRFARFLDTYKPDVIHLHNIYHQLSFSILRPAKERGIPMVMTLHDYKMMSPNYTMYHHGKVDDTMVGGRYYRCLLTNCMENMGQSLVATLEAYLRQAKRYADDIDAYLCPSEYVKHIALKANLPKDRLHLVQSPVPQYSKNEETRSVDDGSILYVGRLSEEKGLRTLLRVAEKTPNIPYIIVGDGPLRSELERVNRPNVWFVGYRSSAEVRAYLRVARVLVMPSEWYEVSGLSMLEAINARTFVIGADIGAIPEIVPQECLFPPKNVEKLLGMIERWYHASSDEREQVTSQLFEKVKNVHDPMQYIRKVIDIYDEVV